MTVSYKVTKDGVEGETKTGDNTTAGVDKDKTTTVEFEDNYTYPTIKISKTAVGGGAEIADAVLKITTEDGKEVTNVKGDKIAPHTKSRTRS